MNYKRKFFDCIKDFALERVFPDTLDPVMLRETKENSNAYDEVFEALQHCKADEKENLLEELNSIVMHRLYDVASFAYLRGFTEGIELTDNFRAPENFDDE